MLLGNNPHWLSTSLLQTDCLQISHLLAKMTNSFSKGAVLRLMVTLTTPRACSQGKICFFPIAKPGVELIFSRLFPRTLHLIDRAGRCTTCPVDRFLCDFCGFLCLYNHCNSLRECQIVVFGSERAFKTASLSTEHMKRIRIASSSRSLIAGKSQVTAS